jgi:hypothetical protein
MSVGRHRRDQDICFTRSNARKNSEAAVHPTRVHDPVLPKALIWLPPIVPEALLGQVVEGFDPRRVILVGSRARGDARQDSDYDLVVVLDDAVPDDGLRHSRGHHSLPGS